MRSPLRVGLALANLSYALIDITQLRVKMGWMMNIDSMFTHEFRAGSLQVSIN
ncbi:hypothetical protein JYU34_013583 [Plutella xylostella]|uniref:Uncharacterized protein n=1 Tax=Plutella xylostella TaxID=51655 RepID=A0ABQ7QA67_PLUXY|nr:hypothetical protein JYU34_013583 [Plutella xylostella]